jgi:hypothetical protein
MSALLDSSLLLARTFGPVLPLRPRGKEPLGDLAPHGKDDATTDETTINGWWARAPTANVGLCTGDGFFVLDVDPRNGGTETLAKLVHEHGHLPPTVTVLTGGGGAHHYFKHPGGKLRTTAGIGVDVKREGGYVVAPPSVHPSGELYSWAPACAPREVEIAAAPEWLIELIRERTAPPPRPPPPPAAAAPRRPEAYERARRYLAAMPPAISGSRGHDALFLAAQAMVRGFQLSSEDSLQLLLSEYNPRCQPPWTEKEVAHKVNAANDQSGLPWGYLLNATQDRPQIYRQNPPERRQDGEIDESTLGKDELAARNDRPPVGYRDVIAQIDAAAKHGPVTREFWRPLLFAARLEATDQEFVLEHLVALGVGAKRPLTREWKDYALQQERAEHQRAATERRLTAVNTGKTIIKTSGSEEQIVRTAERALVAANDPELPLMRDANAYVRPVVDQPDWARARDGYAVPTIAMLRNYDEPALRWALDRHVVLEGPPNEEGECPVLKPDDCASRLLENPLPAAPRVRGLVTHPLVRADGRLVEEPGLDTESGLYLHLGGELGTKPTYLAPPIPIPQDASDAWEQARRFAQELLADYADYRFESEVDKVVALSARMGILVRKNLDIAPAYLLVGPERGTGKTTLAAIDHVIATGHDIAVARLEDDEEKAKQTLFAAFVSSPAAVLFDNLPADSSFSSSVLSAALTKGYVETRLFHTQRTGRASTNLQVYFTGNAVVLDEDLQARTLEVRFSPERPTHWTHPDWLAHARATREETRAKLQFIQRAYVVHGQSTRGVYIRFDAWGRRVRDPLLWAGLADIGKRIQELEDRNPNRAADAQMLAVLAERYPSRKFTAGELATALGAGGGDVQPDFIPLKEMLQERRPSALGKAGAQVIASYFREHLRRWFEVDGHRLRLAETQENGRARWRVEVEAVDDSSPALV